MKKISLIFKETYLKYHDTFTRCFSFIYDLLQRPMKGPYNLTEKEENHIFKKIPHPHESTWSALQDQAPNAKPDIFLIPESCGQHFHDLDPRKCYCWKRIEGTDEFRLVVA